jgi:HSP20 family protein
MTLVRFKPFDAAPVFADILENFVKRDVADSANNYTGKVPAVNIYENSEEFRLDVAAPGLKRENIKLNLDNNLLTISSEISVSEENGNDKCNRREFDYSSFKRTFTLPQSVDTEKISAKYADGVLSVYLAKKEEAKIKPVREIEIS